MVVRQEEDTDFDGDFDLRSRPGAKGVQVTEADTNGDGAIDTWIKRNSAGEVIERAEDRSGDGKPDRIAYF